jgi:hypothetical protein
MLRKRKWKLPSKLWAILPRGRHAGIKGVMLYSSKPMLHPGEVVGRVTIVWELPEAAKKGAGPANSILWELPAAKKGARRAK